MSVSAPAADHSAASNATGFAALGLSPALLASLEAIGYTEPTPIQARCIPALLEGRDLVGLAQTGTGKTAAFALPLVQRLDPSRREVQALVLAPTREQLARQVSSAIEPHADAVGGLRVVTIYGGAPIGRQLQALDRGVHVVVGTPGRVMDCMRRGALTLDTLRMFVLDEADEMLRMGFAEDIEWIVEQAPKVRQTALFSATMPPAIQRAAQVYLDKPVKVEVQRATRTVANTEERVVLVHQRDKLDALVRILETVESEAVLVFARTKAGCDELAEALNQYGHPAAALHGDMNQGHRQEVVHRLESGQLRLVIATDVAARGLDVDGITHVINFDPPTDPETYVHRIGRTGRAGRDGMAVLFLTPRERGHQRVIERYTRQEMIRVGVPSDDDIARRRHERFQRAVLATIAERDLTAYREAIDSLLAGSGHDLATVAAAIAEMACRRAPLMEGVINDYVLDLEQEAAPEPVREAPAKVVVKKASEALASATEEPAHVAAVEAPVKKVRKPRKAAEAPAVEVVVAAAQEAPAAEVVVAEKPAATAKKVSEAPGAPVAADKPAKKARKATAKTATAAPAPASDTVGPVSVKLSVPVRELPAEIRALVDEQRVDEVSEAPEEAAAPTRAPRVTRTRIEAGDADGPVVVRRMRPAPVAPRQEPAGRAQASEGEMVRLFISLGRQAGLRPGDLVGAIANEGGVPASAVGAIEIGDRFSFFGLRSDHVDGVIERMGETTIRGRRAGIRIARPDAPGPDAERSRGGAPERGRGGAPERGRGGASDRPRSARGGNEAPRRKSAAAGGRASQERRRR